MLKGVFNEHLSREFVITQGYQHIYEMELISEEENQEFAHFIATHPHKVWSMKILKDAGVPGAQEMDDALDETLKK